MDRIWSGARVGSKLGAVLALAALITTAMGCKKETVGAMGDAVQEKGAPIAVTLTRINLERVEIEGDTGPLIFKDPVLAVYLKFENSGQTNIFYKPTHAFAKASNLEAPLLFVDPGPKGELRENISGVLLDGGLFEGQMEKQIDLEPGAVAEDVYLFEQPKEGQTALVLTIPPAVHGGQGLIKIKFTYEPQEVPAAKVYGTGEDIAVGDASINVKGGEIVYLDLVEGKTKGFSKEPVFKVTYTIKNNGKEAITYEPGHTRSGQALAPSLLQGGGSGRYLRARFGSDREVKGQVARQATIEPGKSKKDFAVFERPPQNVKGVRLLMPGRLFGQTGVVRVEIPYVYKDPKKPAALGN